MFNGLKIFIIFKVDIVSIDSEMKGKLSISFYYWFSLFIKYLIITICRSMSLPTYVMKALLNSIMIIDWWHTDGENVKPVLLFCHYSI